MWVAASPARKSLFDVSTMEMIYFVAKKEAESLLPHYSGKVIVCGSNKIKNGHTIDCWSPVHKGS